MIAGPFESGPSSGGSDGGADEGGTIEPPPPAPGRSPEGGEATCVASREAASAGQRVVVERLPSSATSVATAPEGVVSDMTETPENKPSRGWRPAPRRMPTERGGACLKAGNGTFRKSYCSYVIEFMKKKGVPRFDYPMVPMNPKFAAQVIN